MFTKHEAMSYKNLTSYPYYPFLTFLQLYDCLVHINILMPSLINFFLQEQFDREEQFNQEQRQLQTTPPNRHQQNAPVSYIKHICTDCMPRLI